MSQQFLDTTVKSRKPKNSAFFQQKLPAWQPMFTAKKSGIMFIVFGIILLPIGVVLLLTSNNVIEYYVDYTDCTQTGSQVSCSVVAVSGNSCICSEQVSIKTFIPGPVFVYYSLSNFYQNHRRYARSKNDDQLLGSYQDPSSLSSCEPYSSIDGKAILPCGAVANSIFNDTFTIQYVRDDKTKVTVDTLKTGIAWPSDIARKFGVLDGKALNNTVKPPNWPVSIQQRSPKPFPTDEDLIVWMRIAALPFFRKLYGRVSHAGDFTDGMPPGTYEITIRYSYPVASFNGRKAIIIANTSWLGAKNPSLGIACLITGCTHLFIGIFFLVGHFFWTKRPILPPSAALIRCAE
ncbi:unnamed protein product [Trichobilharzia szidati]|nr:unnamed protein product [Trichobilharzia szidati]